MQKKLNIAIYAIDDDANTRTTLDALFRRHEIINYEIFSDPQKLLESLHQGVQICIIDYNLKNGDYTGLSLMKEILERNGYCKCIIMSGFSETMLIIDFLNSGAFRYLIKGEKRFAEKLILFIQEAIEVVVETFNFYTTVLKNLRGATDELKEVKNG